MKCQKAYVSIILKRAQAVGAMCPTMNFECARHSNAAGWITGPSEWGASCRPVGHSARGVQKNHTNRNYFTKTQVAELEDTE